MHVSVCANEDLGKWSLNTCWCKLHSDTPLFEQPGKHTRTDVHKSEVETQNTSKQCIFGRSSTEIAQVCLCITKVKKE